jgi:hypothetical protein
VRDHDVASRSFEQPKRGKPDARPHQVHEAGDEKADAHGRISV